RDGCDLARGAHRKTIGGNSASEFDPRWTRGRTCLRQQPDADLGQSREGQQHQGRPELTAPNKFDRAVFLSPAENPPRSRGRWEIMHEVSRRSFLAASALAGAAFAMPSS